jgi:hypothetical protein
MLGLGILLLGATIAYAAGRLPAHLAVLETVSGALLISGFALLGLALPVIP